MAEPVQKLLVFLLLLPGWIVTDALILDLLIVPKARDAIANIIAPVRVDARNARRKPLPLVETIHLVKCRKNQFKHQFYFRNTCEEFPYLASEEC